MGACGCPQDAHGQIMEAFSISAGLDCPGVGLSTVISTKLARAT